MAPVARKFTSYVLGTLGWVLVVDRICLYKVGQPDDLFFRADRELDGDGIGLELGDDLIEGALEVRADAVHLVDEADPRDAVLVGLAPDGLRLRLDAGARVEHGDRAVEHAQRAADFARGTDAARRA